MTGLSSSDYEALLQRFPETRFAFAYGSGAIEQGGYSDRYTGDPADAPMLDLIFAVDDPVSWHLENKRLNPGHYTSLLSALPHLSGTSNMALTLNRWQAIVIAYFQEEYGAKVWFNAMVPMGIPSASKRLMKYGVISTTALIEDMQNWHSLYIAGRLHKPIRVIYSNAQTFTTASTSHTSEIDFHALMKQNYKYAVATAVLLNAPDQADSSANKIDNSKSELLSEHDLYLSIAGLSYTGDPRMSIAENPDKVANLVHPIEENYQNLYRSIIKNLTKLSGMKIVYDANNRTDIKLKICPKSFNRVYLYEQLAPNIRKQLTSHNLSRTTLSSSITRIVRSSATSQSIKGLVTVGFLKSAVYSWQKIKKRLGMK